MEMKRSLLRAALAACALAFAAASPAQTPDQYPRHTVTIVVPYSPGGVADLVARALAEVMAKDFKQPVIVENRGGAGGLLGAAAVARSKPDGYTLLLTNDAIQSTAAHTTKQMQIDPLKDLAAVALVASSPLVLAVNPSVPAKNMQELIAHAKRNPGKLSFGSSGNGTPHHLAGEMLARLAGVELVHVPYKGTSNSVQDAAGGQIQLVFSAMTAVQAFAKSGRLNLVGITASKPSAVAPGVPPIADTVKDYRIELWLGIVAPSGTPAPVIAALNQEVNRALKAPEVAARLEQQGLAPLGGPASEMERRMRADFESRGALIKAIGLQPE
jgi:tripartite-type tricarboxylate transporter receptor subunit TctC